MMDFIKVPNQVHPSKALSLPALGLYALSASYLCIPHFKASNGGFKEALRGHCAEGRTAFDTSWKSLINAGYLKMTRIPVNQDYFCYRYELRTIPDVKTPAVRNMTSAEGRAYLEKEKAPYHVPENKYVEVSCPVLMDVRLSASAKGLYALIRQEMNWAEKSRTAVTKSRIMKKCREGKCAFNSAWNQLKNTGYLVQERVIDPATCRIHYEYELISNPAKLPQGGREAARKSVQVKVPGQAVSTVTDDRRPVKAPRTPADRAAVEEIVRGNLQYDELRKLCGHDAAGRCLNLIVGAVCTGKKALRIGGEDVPAQTVREQLLKLTGGQVRDVLDRIARQKRADCPKAYLLTALYRASAEKGSALKARKETSFDLEAYGAMVASFSPVYQPRSL